MEYSIENNSELSLIVLRGSFTFTDNVAFKTIITALEKCAPAFIVIDFAQTAFIDSAALGMLLLLREELRKHTNLIVLRRAQGQVRRMFEISKFDNLFSLEE